MDYNINIYNLLIGFGMLQGFIFGAFLCWKSRFKGAQNFLGLTVLFLSFYLLWVLKYDYGFQRQNPFLQFLPVLFLWGIGPAFFAYLRSLFGNPLPSKTVRWILFLPLILEQLYFNSCTFLFWLNNWDVDQMSAFQKIWVKNLFNAEHIIGLISIGFYLLKSYRFLKSEGVLYASNKIRSILICFALIWVIWVPYTIMDIVYYNFGFPPSEFYSFYLLMAVLTYGIGFFGFKINDETISKVRVAPPVPIEGNEQHDVSEEMQQLADRIKNYMISEKSFLDPELNLAGFSEKVDLHPNKVSAIVNSVLGYSFRDFVNDHRVKEFKSRITTYDLKSKTILSLAYECGFNSKASFNRIFKKFCDCSPGEYLSKTGENKAQNIK